MSMKHAARPTFLDVARTIAPKDTPPWLAVLLEDYGAQIAKERELQEDLPTKAYIKEKLVKIDHAAQILIELLNDATAMVFIEAESNAQIDVIVLETHLRRFANAVQLAAASRAITGAKGKAKRGRGKATARIWLSPKDYCALVVAETWLFIRGRRPGPRELEAGTAAHNFWLASGATKNGWGKDPQKGWRNHFSEARSPQMRAMQTELRQKCIELAGESETDSRPGGK